MGRASAGMTHAGLTAAVIASGQLGAVKNEQDIFDDIDSRLSGIAAYAGAAASKLKEQLAERVGWSVGNVSQLERGLQGYSDEGLVLLAEALHCTPGQILEVDPTQDDAIWSLWERAKPAQRQTLLEVAKGMVGKTGTDS